MMAAVLYGREDLKIEKVPIPVIGPEDVLVRVKVALTCVLRGIEETGVSSGDTAVVIGCGPIGLKFIRIMSSRGVRVIAVGKRKSQMQTAQRLGAAVAIDLSEVSDPVSAVRDLTHR